MTADSMSHTYRSWGGYPQAQHRLSWIDSRSGATVPSTSGSVLPRGLGRSYGDSCLNDQNCLLLTARLDHFIHFDQNSGVLEAESGVSLEEILALVVPLGWFLPVVPGTQYVTLGGAIANDIHGKNHHRVGTFGRHVRSIELLRSDNSRHFCSLDNEPSLFAATIGGLGLTGLIVSATVQLVRVASPLLDVETLPITSLDHFFEITQESEDKFEYTVAWIDALQKGANAGRGVFFRGNHAAGDHASSRSENRIPRKKSYRVPFHAPNWILNRLTIRAFNDLYYRIHRELVPRQEHYTKFFFPLDSLHDWNKIYGRRGFLQYQLVVPQSPGNEALRAIFDLLGKSQAGSFLSVLKIFGNIPSPGILSFPRAGATLAIDFPNTGRGLFDLLDNFDKIVADAGGAVYPAKDARMSAESFRKFFPRYKEFAEHIDPRFSSSFWRRVNGLETNT